MRKNILNELGVSEQVQALFAPSFLWDAQHRLVFPYGGPFEYYCSSGHQIPTSNRLWTSGLKPANLVRQLFICSSAMEAIAFLSIHYQSFPHLGNLLFVSMGLVPDPLHYYFIRSQFRCSRIALIMGNDLMGRVADIKIAAGIRQKQIQILLMEEKIKVNILGHDHFFDHDRLSLSAVEKCSGLRSGLRTFKPKLAPTFLEQLQL